MIRYLPMKPWTRLRSLHDLYVSYGKQILREQGPNIDPEKKSNSKDMMSILSKPQPQLRLVACALMTFAIPRSQGQPLCRCQVAPGRRRAHRDDS